MNAAERWLVEVAVILRQPLRTLVAEPSEVEGWFNRGHHGLDRAAVAETLRALSGRGWIVLHGPDGAELEHRAADAALDALASDDPPEPTVFYGLTAAGGAAWEVAARPDWRRFISASYGVDPAEGEVLCADLARAEWYALSPHNPMQAVRGSLRHERVAPWRATYWKPLPSGHRVAFRYRPAPASLTPEAVRARSTFLREANAWFREDVG